MKRRGRNEGEKARGREDWRSRKLFYMYAIIKINPDVYITKKFRDTSISSCFFVLTYTPFWTE